MFKQYRKETLVPFIPYINTAKGQRRSDWLNIKRRVGINARKQESEKNRYLFNTKQILHTFSFNIRNYSPEASNTQGHEAEQSIFLPWASNSDIKHKMTWIHYIPLAHYYKAPVNFFLLNCGKSIHEANVF